MIQGMMIADVYLDEKSKVGIVGTATGVDSPWKTLGNVATSER